MNLTKVNWSFLLLFLFIYFQSGCLISGDDQISAGLMEKMKNLMEKEKVSLCFGYNQVHFGGVINQLLRLFFFFDKYCYLLFPTGKNERTVVMDKSKGEPVISVKTKSKSRDRVSSLQPCNTYNSEVSHSWGS